MSKKFISDVVIGLEKMMLIFIIFVLVILCVNARYPNKIDIYESIRGFSYGTKV